MLSLLRRLLNGHIQCLNEGIGEFQQGNIDGAISSFDEGLKIHSTFLPLWNSKGIVLIYKKQYENAITCFAKVLKYDPNNPTALLGQGVAHTGQNNIPSAIQTYNRVDPLQIYFKRDQILDSEFVAYAIYAKLASIKICLGFRTLDSRFAKLIDPSIFYDRDDSKMIESISCLPGQNFLSMYLCFCNLVLSMQKAPCEVSFSTGEGYAMDDTLRGVRIKAKIIKGSILSLQAKWQEALQLFENIPELLPLSMPLMFVECNGQWPAEYLFHRKGFSEREEKKIYLAIIKMHLGRLIEAKDHFDAALKDNPSSVEAKIGLGMLFLLQDKWIQAKDHFQKIIEEDQDSTVGRVYKGYALLNNREFSEARNCFERVCQRNTQSALATLGKSLVAYADQDYEKADVEYRQALTILNARSEYVAERLECYLFYGKSCLVLGAFDKTRAALEQALQFNPDYIHARRALEEAYKTKLQQATSNNSALVQLLEQTLQQSVNNVNASEEVNKQLEVKIIQLNHEVEVLEESLKNALDNSEKAERIYQNDLAEQKKLISSLMVEIERQNNFSTKNKSGEKVTKNSDQENKELKLINEQKDKKILELKQKIRELETKISNLPIRGVDLASNPTSHWNRKISKRSDTDVSSVNSGNKQYTLT